MSRNAFIDINGIQSLKVLFDRIKGGVKSTRLMSEIATFLITSIKLRTAKGQDVNEAAFKPYSKGYAMFRSKAGYSTKVDLFFSGSMMASMDYTATPTTAKLFFRSSEDKSGTSNPDKAYWLNKKREFFALSSNDMNKIENIVDDFITRGMRS